MVLIGISVPSFWLGMLMILLFAVNLRWLPASGMYAIYGGGDLLDLLRHLRCRRSPCRSWPPA